MSVQAEDTFPLSVVLSARCCAGFWVAPRLREGQGSIVPQGEAYLGNRGSRKPARTTALSQRTYHQKTMAEERSKSKSAGVDEDDVVKWTDDEV